MAVISAAAGTALLIFIVRPLLIEQSRVDKELKVSSARLARYQTLLKRDDLLSGKTERSGKTTSAGSLSGLEQLAKQEEVKIVDMRPEKTEGGCRTVIIKTEAPLPAYIRFFYRLEESAGTRLSRCQMAARPGSQDIDAMCTIELEGARP